MKQTGKALLTVGMFLLCVVLSFSVGASTPQTRYTALPASSIPEDQLALFPGKNGRFYLLSSRGDITHLSRFDAVSGQLTPLLDDDLPYTSAVMRQDTLLIAASSMRYDPEQHEFVRFTKFIRYQTETDTSQTWIITDLYLEGGPTFAVDHEGTLYAVDSEDNSSLRVYTPDGALENTIPCTGRISSVTAQPNGHALYLTYADSNRFEKLNASSAMPETLSTPAPALPYRFLSDTGYADSLGEIYTEVPSGFAPSLSTLCPKPTPWLFKDQIVCIPSQGPLLLLDRTSGEATGQFALQGEAQALAVSGRWAAVLLDYDGEVRIGCVDLSTPQPLEPQRFTPGYGLLSTEQITEAWKAALPQQRDIGRLYSQHADLEAFTHPAVLSDEALADGIRAVNFYRSLYGLPPVGLASTGSRSFGCGAVLSLLLGEDAPSPPDGMPEEFFSIASEACRNSFTAYLDSLSPYPLAIAVHDLFQSDNAFREQILSPGLTTLSFGAASKDDGSTAVLVSHHPEETAPLSAYPPGGASIYALSSDCLWSLRLDDGLLAGIRGTPRVILTDRSSGNKLERRLGDGLFLDGRGLMWEPPAAGPAEYSVRVENLCTPAGIPAVLEYEVSLFDWDVTLPKPTEPPERPEEDKRISSAYYQIDRENGWITGITPSTSAAAFRRNLTGNGDLVVKKNNRPVTSGNAGTGMCVQLLQNGQVVDELTLLVYGDMTGEGNINTLDQRALWGTLLEEKSLAEPFARAADLNRDGVINTLDLLALNKFLAGSYEISQDS